MSTLTPEAKTPAWFVTWECHCAATSTVLADLPETCPGHGRVALAKPELLDVIDQYVNAHDCTSARVKCPEVKA